MVTFNILAVAMAFAVCVPSAIIAFAFWCIEKKIERRDKEEEAKREARQKEVDNREKRRQENEFMTLRCVNASLALSEATAKAVQRIPDAHCNGDMDQALSYADEVKHQQKEFIEKASIQSIYTQHHE